MKQFYIITAFLLLFQLSVKGQNQLTNREIYNFQVGDIFHTKSFGDSTFLTYTKRQILAKQESENSDTIYFEVLDSFISFDSEVKMFLDKRIHTIFFTDLDSLPILKETEFFDESQFIQSVNKGLRQEEISCNLFDESAVYKAIESVGLYYSIWTFNSVKVYELLYFERDTIQIGEKLPEFSTYRQLTNRDVYDFEIGNQVHHEYHEKGQPSTYWSSEVLDKQVFPDSIRYLFLIHKNEFVKDVWDWVLTSESKWITYTNLDNIPDLNEGGRMINFISVYDNDFNAHKNIYTYRSTNTGETLTVYEGIGKFNYYGTAQGSASYWNDEKLWYAEKNGQKFGKPLSIKSVQNNTTTECLVLYPNPAQDEIALEWKGEYVAAQVQVYDMQGKKVFSTEWTSELLHINTQSWTNGIYPIRIGEQIVRKVMIVR